MFKKARPFFVYAETPIHVGSGSELGYVDLPIQREKHSGFPKIEASGLKGSFRGVFNSDEELKDKVKYIFGPEDGDLYAGGLGFIDGRILLFPVKSIKGIFAWITCPYVLSRFKEEMMLCSKDEAKVLDGIEAIEANSITEDTSLKINDNSDVVILEEYQFKVKKDDKLKQFSEWLASVIFPQAQGPSHDVYSVFRNKMRYDIVVLSDDDFRDFTEMSTEVITRTKIDPKRGTVQDGALFNEEYVPENTVFYSIALASLLFGIDDKEKERIKGNEKTDEDYILDYFFGGIKKYDVMQIGGNATIGKGIVRVGAIKGGNGNA